MVVFVANVECQESEAKTCLFLSKSSVLEEKKLRGGGSSLNNVFFGSCGVSDGLLGAEDCLPHDGSKDTSQKGADPEHPSNKDQSHKVIGWDGG